MEVNEISEYQKEKGEQGEQVVFQALTKFIDPVGFIFHSYEYKMVEGLPGNIKKLDDGSLQVQGIAEKTELDILLCTSNFLYPIEVKTYSGNVRVTGKELIRPGNAYSDKSPVHQNEMHCRHLYNQIYYMIPDGKPNYIKPLVIFADKNCCITDERDVKEVKYIPVATITNAIKLIAGYERNPNPKTLNVQEMYKELKKIGSCKKELKVL